MICLYFTASDHTAWCGYNNKKTWRAPWCIFTFQHLITRCGVDIIKNHNPDEPHDVPLLSSIWSYGVVWTLSNTTTLTSPMICLYFTASDHTAWCGYNNKKTWRAPWCIFTFQHLITRCGVDIIKNHNPDEPHDVPLLSSIWSYGVVWTLSNTTTLTSPKICLYFPASDHTAWCGYNKKNLTSTMMYLYFPASDYTAWCGHYQKPQPWRAPWCIFTFQDLIIRRGVDIIKHHNPDEPQDISLLSSIWSHGVVWI